MKSFDFIVIGSGIAGLNFALRVAEYGSVLVLTKKHVAESGTNYAQGGIAAVLSKVDSFEAHIEDTLKSGGYHNDRKRVEMVVRSAPKAIRELVGFGVGFDENCGEIDLRLEGGHSFKRIVHVGDYSGKAIEEALVEQVRLAQNIEVREDAFVCDLVIEGERCVGVKALIADEMIVMPAQAVVLAAGGAGQIFRYTTNPAISTGDGYGMASRVGADFRDMEFVQFHPTVFAIEGESKFLLTEALRGEGAKLCLADGSGFLSERGFSELSGRDVLSRAIFEILERGEEVFLRFEEKDADGVMVKFPMLYKRLEKEGYDLAKDLIPVVPAAHFFCGGVKTDDDGRALRGGHPIEGLFAFGEVAGTGVHGANRLASNSLLEALVFSSRIEGVIKSLVVGALRESEVIKSVKLSGEKLEQLSQFRDKIKDLMWQKAGVVRERAALEEAGAEVKEMIEELEGLAKLNPSNEIFWQTYNMALTASLVIEAALKRPESLGGHFREN